MHPAPVEGARDRLHLEQRQLRRAKDDDIELVIRRRVAGEKGLDLVAADGRLPPAVRPAKTASSAVIPGI